MSERVNYTVNPNKLQSKGLLYPPLYLSELTYRFHSLRKPRSFFHFTDSHFGLLGLHTWLPPKVQRKLVETMVQQITSQPQPVDGIFFNGDLGTYLSEFPWFPTDHRILANMMQPFKYLDVPKFATLGNHDLASNANREVLEDVGFQLLPENKQDPVIYNYPDENISIWSLPDLGRRRPEHEEMSAHIKNWYRGMNPDVLPIILAHNPDSADLLPGDMQYLMLAGHTHGGAYQNETIKKLALAKLGLQNKEYAQGVIERKNSILFVSSGAGRHTLTPWSNWAREITMIHLLPE